MVSAGGDSSSHRQFFGVVALRIQLVSYLDWTIASGPSSDSEGLLVLDATVGGFSQSLPRAISRSEVVVGSSAEDVIGG